MVRPLVRPDWLPDGMTHRTCSSRRREQSLMDCGAEVVALTIRGLAALGGPDGAPALAAAVRLVDRPGDESTWRLP